MFKNRIQISRLSSVDGLVCNAGDLELDALVNWKPVIMFGISKLKDMEGIGIIKAMVLESPVKYCGVLEFCQR